MARPTILLVDDEAATARVIWYTCTDAGLRLVWAATSAEAHAAIALVRVDLILCDVMLPGVSGLVLAADLHAIQPVPTLILSALPATPLIPPPGMPVLTKPVSPTRLLQEIQQHLASHPAPPAAP